ncbi:MAG: hypothetical protein WC389_21520 [Lutibacter sp.]|jgi:hypothetical protein
MPIFCIGDSHVSLFAGVNEVQPVWPKQAKNLLPFFQVFPLGPVLAYNLVSPNTKTKGREKLFKVLQKEVPKGSLVLLSFGEIDCRAHLLKQGRLQKRTIELIVSECVDRYFSVILEVRKIGFKPLIWNTIPSSRLSNINSKDYPTFGSCKERNIVTSMFNKKLENKCIKNKIYFISTYNYFVDKDGLTDMTYYMDTVHLSQKAMQVTLKVIGKELGVNFKLPLYQFIEYKLVNLYLDSLNALKKLKRKFKF